MANDILDVLYIVKERVKKKQIKMVGPALPMEQFMEKKEQLRSNKQISVVDFFISHPEPIARKEILTKLQITSSVIKGLIDKGILQETLQEIYRDPYADRTFQHTKPLVLTEEQSNAIHPIKQTISQYKT